MFSGFYLEIILAIKVTISVAVGASVFGIIIGLVSALLEFQPRNGLAIKLINMFIRGIPEILILFVIYFGITAVISKISGSYFEINPLTAGIIALGIIFQAYAAEVFIAAFNAIDKGEIKAAQALGMTNTSCFIAIILPQIGRHALPGLFNLWLVILKDSSIVSLIGLNDMTNQAQIAANQSFEPFTYYGFVGLLYLGLTAISQIIYKGLNHWFSRGHYA
ncbi:ABC transporter permease subunit [Thiotrichales bacterium 19S3-7]|nr:ABC transporter permease subunit [Thiotrichales bacterium 19S3-7]MCF6802644.1 ABC transporter permease subunit [Thiotrichales bacterium 19S3-11]